MILSMTPRMSRQVPYGIPLRQLQAHRLQSGITPPQRLQQTQSYHSPRRQNLRDEKRRYQSLWWYAWLMEHFRRNDLTYTNIGLGSTIFVAAMESMYPDGPPSKEELQAMDDMAIVSRISSPPKRWES
ncbi:hypothetical protein IWW34DRAFT_854476 [Fusarium oxysporum f. sp. albedinis]|uniref:Uncharacterized protein n=6 Tax=Fusarium oxysporum TaxID=5507 RepID=A0A2H3HVZ3_FUSOX|nr:uncharacterized protein FOBCDRAFT_266569 [Fusarium oxysporum Fo47]KAH7492965.1 hypothetical protein FOMA001_g1863 [Fusarium oxysporum f. sp. matthiolae]KAI3574323.1 hypothetical protein IWW34DRAFT_854476 [Fusarium oxysporum f. sp. albedinis]KAJ4125931.1 hypothetical protein NW765_001706 [Fusarium oxysporum]PCD46387.1 hypothetical protein AU210_001794 [Fusarium oxysporum f. sp. radicis-cucumerinum]RYC85487.1 hypothetical protein BFJ63_vAg11587 [Fusarium oxysporum f. sp. narcissi]